MARPVTLDDVARVAGVSASTVSRALNGRSGVKDEVRERIEHVAGALGYSPNRAAQNLAIGQSLTIGLVVPSAELSVDPYGASLVHAVARAADASGYNLMLFLTSSEPGGPVRSNLRGGLIDGVIISAVAVGNRWIEELLDIPVPTVLVGSHPNRTDVPVVDTENRLSVARAVHHLFDQGRRRVAIITGPLHRVDAAQRLEGWRLAHEERGIPVDEELVVGGEFNRRSGAKAGYVIAERKADALFASNDEMALGAISSFAKVGLTVPGDIAVAGFDGVHTLGFEGVHSHELDGASLTTLRQPFDELGRAAIDQLLALMGGATGATYSTLDPELVVGHTTVVVHQETATAETRTTETTTAETRTTEEKARPPP